MLDIKLIREEPNKVKEDLKRRPGFDVKIVDAVLKADEAWKSAKYELDKLKAEKNKESMAISQLKKDKKDIKPQLEKVKKVAEKIDKKDLELKELETKRDNILIKIPNILDKEVPLGADDEENVQIKLQGKKPRYDFGIKDHRVLCEINNWLDLDIAAKHSGARFYYLRGELVMLQNALINYTLDKLNKKGFTPIEVPPMLRAESLGKSVSLEDFQEAIYGIDGEDLCLIGTSEHALALLHADEKISHKNLPLRYCSLSQCFRKEAGVTKDSKGIFRVHNFNKIEQFVFCKPKDSDKILNELISNAEEIFQDLELHYRIVDICSGDIGSFASRKFDLEAYLPSQDKYREMVSASNYRNYGARRLNCRYQNDKGELEYVNTLNSTAIALSRLLIALLEQHQTKNGNVKIPKVLQKYFGRESLKE